MSSSPSPLSSVSDGVLSSLHLLYRGKENEGREKVRVMSDYLQRIIDNPKIQYEENQDRRSVEELKKEMDLRDTRVGICPQKRELIGQMIADVSSSGSDSEVKTLQFILRMSLSLSDEYTKKYHEDAKNSLLRMKYGKQIPNPDALVHLSEWASYLEEKEREEKESVSDDERKIDEYELLSPESLANEKKKLQKKMDELEDYVGVEKWMKSSIDMLYGVEGPIFYKENGVFTVSRDWSCPQYFMTLPLVALANGLSSASTLLQCLLHRSAALKRSAIFVYVDAAMNEISAFRKYAASLLSSSLPLADIVNKLRDRSQLLFFVLSATEFIDRNFDDNYGISVWKLIDYFLNVATLSVNMKTHLEEEEGETDGIPSTNILPLSSRSNDSGFCSARSEHGVAAEFALLEQSSAPLSPPQEILENVFTAIMNFVHCKLLSFLLRGDADEDGGVIVVDERDEEMKGTLGDLVRSSHMSFCDGSLEILGVNLHNQLLDEGRTQKVLEELKSVPLLPVEYTRVLELDELSDDPSSFSFPQYIGSVTVEEVRTNAEQLLSHSLSFSASPPFTTALRDETIQFIDFLSRGFLFVNEQLLHKCCSKNLADPHGLLLLSSEMNTLNDRFRVEMNEKNSYFTAIIPEPLSLVFKQTHMDAYSRIQILFRTLFSADMNLHDLFVHTLSTVDALYLRRLTFISASMSTFVSGLRLSFTLPAASTYESLKSSLSSCTSSRQLFDIHKKSLSLVAVRTLCTHRTAAASMELYRTLRYISHFCESVRQSEYEKALCDYKEFMESAQLFCGVLMQDFSNTDWANNILTTVDLVGSYRDFSPDVSRNPSRNQSRMEYRE